MNDLEAGATPQVGPGMSELPYLREIFEQLTRGAHLGPDDEPWFSALSGAYDAYAGYFRPLGFALMRHKREFFYFEPREPERVHETLPRIAVFAYILIDHAANRGQSLEEYLLGGNFLTGNLPHFTLERYAALLRQVDVHEPPELRRILDHMERIGWLKWTGSDEFRFLRPFHRVFDKCVELAEADAMARVVAAPINSGQTTPSPA